MARPDRHRRRGTGGRRAGGQAAGARLCRPARADRRGAGPALSAPAAVQEIRLARAGVRPPAGAAARAGTPSSRSTCVSIARSRRSNPADRTLALRDGTVLRYAKLALTTGARPRRLPTEIGGDLAGVFTIRGVADADAIAPLLEPGKRMLVIGGGYIGLEAAAVARTKGMEVTIIEVAERILQRVAAPPTADYFRALHRKHGVDYPGIDRARAPDRRHGPLDRRRAQGRHASARRSCHRRHRHPAQRRPGARRRPCGRQRHRGRRPMPHLRARHLRGGRLRPLPLARRADPPRIGAERDRPGGACRRRDAGRAARLRSRALVLVGSI